MTRFDFIQKTVSYIEQEMLPLLMPDNPFGRFAVGGLMGTLGSSVDNLLIRNTDLLKMLGVMEPSGEISPLGLRSFLEGAFKATPTLEINLYKDLISPKFENELLRSWFDTTIRLTKEDADRYLSFLP